MSLLRAAIQRTWFLLCVALFAAPALAGSAASHASAPPAVSSHYADVGGLKMFYREAGRANEPVIVLLHGFPSSSHMFRDLIPLLADKYHVIAPDYIGFGHSDAPAADKFEYTFDHLAEQVQALLGQLGVKHAVLYMHDYGGPIGMRLAVANPALVRGFVIQNANMYMDGVGQAVADVFMPLWKQGDDKAARGLLLAAGTKFQYTAGTRHPESLNPDSWTLDQALLDRAGSADRQLALFKDYQHNVERYGAWQTYLREHQPKTLVVWGKGDPFFIVPGAEAYRRDLKNVELHLLDTGHFALEEDAPTVAGLIKRRF